MSDIKKYAALVREMQRRAAKDPCWDGYEMTGTKKKNGKTVPNCVPKKKAESDMENIESKKADALNRFLSKYAKQPFDVFPNAHETAEDPSEVDDVEFNKKADNRAMDLDRQIKDSNKSKSGKKYFEPAGTQNQPRDKGVKMPKRKPDAFKSASVTESLFNIYQEAMDPSVMHTVQTLGDGILGGMAVRPAYEFGRNMGKKINETVQKLRPAKPEEPEESKIHPMTNEQAIGNGSHLLSLNSVTESLFNIYQEAYGVQVSPGSGGNFSMGPSIDTTSRGPSPGAGTEGANMENVQWKTKDKKIPKSKLQPGQDPVMPGKIKEAPRYTMMTPDQKVNYVKDDAGNLVTNKSNGAPKTTPGKYDRSPLTEDSLRQLYPSLYEGENKQQQPGKLRQFVDWLKGIHQQTFGGGQMSPDELAEQRVRQNPIQASQIQKFVKTAVADDNQFKTILAAMNEMGYSSGDILAAFD